MIRLLVFFAVLLAAAFGFAWLADRPGEVSVVWDGTRVDTDLMTVLLGAIVLVIAAVVLFVVLRAIWRAPRGIGSFFGRRRRDKGWAALSRGMIAVGAGDLGTAIRAAGEARGILGEEPLALLLEAQSAQLSGDRGGAKRAFEAMLKSPATRLLGLRGLYVEAVRWGEGEAAAEFAAAANAASPKLAWAGQAMIDHRSQTRDWMGALETIDRNRRNGIIDKAAARRLRAVILTADGLERETTHADVVRGNALEAHGLAPDLVPAACLAARLLARNGDFKKAARVIEATWKLMPHPDLAETLARLRPSDSVQDRRGRIRDLAKIRADHPESTLALVRAEIDARDFAAARRLVEPLVRQGPTRRVCLLMADLEEAEHGDLGAARSWLTRAVHAPRDAAWIADGFVAEHWAAVSPVSGRLDAFEWKLPPEEVAGPVTDPIDEADESLALSGSVAPIEAAPVKVAVGEVMAAAPSGVPPKPTVDVTPIVKTETATAEKPVAMAVFGEAPANGAAAPSAATNGRPATSVLDHLPDDPGTDGEPAPAEKKKFRLFN